MLAIGIMSGTSLDGVDAALVEIRPHAERYAVHLRRFITQPFEPALHAALVAALPPNDGTVKDAARLHRDLGGAFAQAALAVAQKQRPSFVASHGQTVWHDGAARVTFQLGDAFVIREAVNATVCYDFRSADTAAGGHGAPLVPFVDALLLGSAKEDRVALNLGGIANVTLLRAGTPPGSTLAFDTGPGNMLIDLFVRERTAGALPFDRDGALARAGSVQPAILDAMLADPYFAVFPPKTTGRERFGAQFLLRHRDPLATLSLEDGAATLAELTAVSVARAIAGAGFSGARVIVSGGGAHNRALLARLAERLNGACVEASDSMGIPADAKEAVAFAVLGYETLRGRAANALPATGAAHPALLGAIAPYDLPELLAAVAVECARA
jgi:anhydro-N-acetylmuramic acid kinase